MTSVSTLVLIPLLLPVGLLVSRREALSFLVQPAVARPAAPSGLGGGTGPAVADTGAATVSSLVPLTDDVITRFVAVKKDLMTFWQTHPTLVAAAQAQAHHPMLYLSNAGVVMRERVEVFNYVAVAAHEPAVAAIFAKHHLAPSQFEPVQLTIIRALFDKAAMIRTSDFSLAPNSIEGRNVILAGNRWDELAALGLAVRLPKDAGE